jgi:hypothetical protein
MATIHFDDPRNWCDRQHHPVWTRVFSARQREQQVAQDMNAGYGIPAILTAIMVFGFLSMVVSVWLAL